MEARFMSLGCFWRHWPRVRVTADFHGNALERSRRHSAQVAAPENWDLWGEIGSGDSHVMIIMMEGDSLDQFSLRFVMEAYALLF